MQHGLQAAAIVKLLKQNGVNTVACPRNSLFRMTRSCDSLSDIQVRRGSPTSVLRFRKYRQHICARKVPLDHCLLTDTAASPEKPSARAAAGVTSMTRPPTYGPRSLIVTVTLLPFFLLVTRTLVPHGSVR